jgi:hypothetical protein
MIINLKKTGCLWERINSNLQTGTTEWIVPFNIYLNYETIYFIIKYEKDSKRKTEYQVFPHFRIVGAAAALYGDGKCGWRTR